MTWTEVNLVLPAVERGVYPSPHLLPALEQVAAPLVREMDGEFWSWHYGYYQQPGDGPGPHIRLRFLWKHQEPARFRGLLKPRWPPHVDAWYCGAHGVAGKAYEGEEAEYGPVWEPTLRLWEAQSEWALALLTCRAAGTLPDGEGAAPAGVGRHWERAVHLASNRLGLPYFDEVWLAVNLAGGYLTTIGKMQQDRTWQVWAQTLSAMAGHVGDQLAARVPLGPLITPPAGDGLDEAMAP